ncbi:MAG: microcystin-dependent protein [Caudoviricetes sp.]|nr:MAG: microcystin-dependent protein [Caudoviricetes sp.]
MKRRFQWDIITALAIPETNITALTHVGAVLLLACSPFYKSRRFYFDGIYPVSDTQWEEIKLVYWNMEHEIMAGLIGAILPHVMGDLTALNLLPCNGAIYSKVDYPLLYEKIDPVYHIDAETFRVPDLRDKFVLGAGNDFALDDNGGEQSHLLTVDEMPLHSHTNTPHSHSEITAVPALADLGTGVPVPSAVVGVGITGAASIAIQNTGGNEAHNNMPPYLAVNWAIVAG